MIKKLALSAILGVSVFGAAQAQETEIANNTQFGDWIVTCEAVTLSRTSCRLVQEQTLVETQTLVARFIAFPGEAGSAVMLAQVPMGVYLPGGAVFRPANDDAAEQRQMTWQRCLGGICEAAIALTPDDLSSFSAAGALLFGYRADINSQPIITEVDVSRFEEALLAIAAAEAGGE